jgi:hypothetical protein
MSRIGPHALKRGPCQILHCYDNQMVNDISVKGAFIEIVAGWQHGSSLFSQAYDLN